MSKTTRRDLLKSGALAGLTGMVGCKVPNGPESATKSETAQKTQAHWQAPAQQKGNGLNLIVLVSDSFRADNLAAYGSNWVETPNLNDFAKESVVFDSFYGEGLPTIPIRRQLYTGRRIFPTHLYFQQDSVRLPGWHELFLEDVTLSETLLAAGYQTALIADLPHLFKPGRNFHRGFTYFEWVRGQEIDFYAQAPRANADFSTLFPKDYLTVVEGKAGGRAEAFPAFLNQYLANRERWLKRAPSIVEATASSTMQWLKENHDQGPFYLQVEVFDPHEPWDPPPHFLEKYLKDPTQHSWPEPPYGNVTVPSEGVKRLRANYAGEASNVDYWYGEVLKTIKSLGLYQNSVVVFLSDHGALLNEQGQWAKGPERLRKQVTHVPLIVHLPENQYAGKRVPGFVQTPDVLPTVLRRLGLNPPARATGEDLWPYITGEKTNQRKCAISSYGYIASVRTPEWNYSTVWNKDKYQGNYPPQLYDLKNDPEELKSVAGQHVQVQTDLQALLDQYIESGKDVTNGSFSEQLS